MEPVTASSAQWPPGSGLQVTFPTDLGQRASALLKAPSFVLYLQYDSQRPPWGRLSWICAVHVCLSTFELDLAAAIPGYAQPQVTPPRHTLFLLTSVSSPAGFFFSSICLQVLHCLP